MYQKVRLKSSCNLWKSDFRDKIFVMLRMIPADTPQPHRRYKIQKQTQRISSQSKLDSFVKSLLWTSFIFSSSNVLPLFYLIFLNMVLFARQISFWHCYANYYLCWSDWFSVLQFIDVCLNTCTLASVTAPLDDKFFAGYIVKHSKNRQKSLRK